MQITNNKIEVTYEMMSEANMTRFGQLGVPIDPSDPSKSLSWKDMTKMSDEDFDKIEEYFLLKEK